MKSLEYFYIIVFGSVLIGCAAEHDPQSELNLSSSTNKELESAALKVIAQNCSSCHGPTSASGGIGNLLDVEYLLNSGLVLPGNSGGSRLTRSMAQGSMPPANPMATPEIQIIKDWIDLGFSNNTTNPTTPSAPPIAGSNTQKAALTIIQNNCFSCHGSSSGAGGISNIMNINHLLNSGLIVKGDSAKGRLMGSIYDKSMPPSQPLNNADITILENWISKEIDEQAQGPILLPEPIKPTFSSIYKLVLAPKCVTCHGPTRADDGIRVDSYNYLLGLYSENKELVKIGNALESKLYKSVHNGEMPPAKDGYVRLDDSEVSAIKSWIDSGALNN